MSLDWDPARNDPSIDEASSRGSADFVSMGPDADLDRHGETVMAMLDHPAAHVEGADAFVDAMPALLPGERVVPVRWQGRSAFVKRTSRQRNSEVVLLKAFAPLARMTLSASPGFMPAVRPAFPAFEVQRLTELRKAGVRVPRVLAVSDDSLVVESAGQPLDDLLADEPDSLVRLEWLMSAARDLAAFHARGHWHGNAQVRNMAVAGDVFARFDFDRDSDRHFPLEIIQALDAALFFSSLVTFVEEPAIGLIARAYFAGVTGAVANVLCKCRPVLNRLARSMLLRRFAPKEYARLRGVHIGLQSLPAE